VLHGDNAQGKTNLLEAIYVLATGKSHRANLERELISWSPVGEGNAVARLVAQVRKNGGDLRVEMVISAPQHASDVRVQKRIKVNGVPRRAIDLVGQINVVPFSVHDIDIIGGEPALRRRYLDIINCQLDQQYLRHLQRYQRVLWQRNRLLHHIAEKQATEDELSFWDSELVQTGAYLTVQRDHLINEIASIARDIHEELSSAYNSLTLVYNSSIFRDRGKGDALIADTVDIYTRSLQSIRGKEIARGVTLVGPHRDDLRFLADNVDIGVFGSRGQQRTIALSLKLAEASYMLIKTGDHPVLLLDDILSELDSRRRDHLLESVSRYRQVLMTTTDLDHFNPGFLEQAALYNVAAGSIRPLTV